MSDEVTVTTDGGSVTLPTSNNDAMEIDSTWLESLFTTLRAELSTIREQLQATDQKQVMMQECLNRLESRLPDNLAGMLTSQQATITELVTQGQETVRAMLTPQQAPLAEPIPEPVSVDVAVMPDSNAEPAREPAERKRRKI